MKKTTLICLLLAIVITDARIARRPKTTTTTSTTPAPTTTTPAPQNQSEYEYYDYDDRDAQETSLDEAEDEYEEEQVPAESSGAGHGPRTQFHEQGVHGPHSYKFGFDTADPHNRQTRYEERDNQGVVRGHYTYMDPHGKKVVVHYEAHPKYGFRAYGPKGSL